MYYILNTTKGKSWISFMKAVEPTYRQSRKTTASVPPNSIFRKMVKHYCYIYLNISENSHIINVYKYVHYNNTHVILIRQELSFSFFTDDIQ